MCTVLPRLLAAGGGLPAGGLSQPDAGTEVGAERVRKPSIWRAAVAPKLASTQHYLNDFFARDCYGILYFNPNPLQKGMVWYRDSIHASLGAPWSWQQHLACICQKMLKRYT
jgi:hypothetical protein